MTTNGIATHANHVLSATDKAFIAGARALEHELSNDQQQPAVRVMIAPKLH